MAMARNPFAANNSLVDPEQESDFLANLQSTASPLLSGLSSLGFAIEKYGGARAAKGLLAGKPQELLSILPFSDQLGITNASDRTGGAELLNTWGLTSQKDPSLFSGEGAAGLAADIVLDPLNLLTFGAGALSNLGKAAGKAGVSLKGGAARAAGLAQGSEELTKAAKYLSSTPEALSGVPGFYSRPVADVARDIAGKSLGGNVGFGLPFGMSDKATAVIPWSTIGENLAKVPLAGPALAGTGKVLQGLGRVGGAAFDKSTKGYLSELGQVIARKQTAAEAGARAAGIRDLHAVMDAAPGVNWADDATQIRFRNAIEDPTTLLPNDPLAPAVTKAQQLFQQERGMLSDYYNAAELTDPLRGTQYGPRSASPEYTTPGFLKPAVKPELEIARKEAFKIGLKTEEYNKFLSEPINSRSVKDLTDKVRNDYLKFTPVEEAEMLRLKAAPVLSKADADRLAALENAWNGAEKLAEFKAYLGDINYKFFDKPVMVDMAAKFTRSYQRHSNAVELHKGILAASMDAASAGPEAVSILKTLQDAKLVTGVGGTSLPMQRTIDALSEAVGRKLTAAEAMLELQTRVIPKADYLDIVRDVSTFTKPDWLKKTLDVVDSATNMFRGLVTQIWPSYLLRNFTSNMAQSVIYKGFDPTAATGMQYLKPFLDARKWRLGEVIDDAHLIPEFAGMSAKQASDELGKRIIQWDIAGKGQFEHMAQLPANETLRELIPGLKRQGWGEVGANFKGKGVGSYVNPFGVKGVVNPFDGWKVNKTDVNPLVGAGRDISTMADAQQRVALFIAKKRQGLSDEAARADVLKAFMNFSNLSQFETGVMRRMMPFYGWCVPVESSEVLTRDGWKKCDDLIVGEDVMTYNVKEDRLDWEPCEDKHIFEAECELEHWERKGNTAKPISFEYTAGHRWPVRTYTTDGKYKRDIVLGDRLRSQHSFIMAAEMFCEDSILTPDQARLLGWVMTDGYTRWRGNHLEVVLYQHPNKYLEEVKVVAGGHGGCSPHPNGTVTVPVRRDLIEPLKPYLDRDKLIKVVTRLSRAAAEAMYDAMYKADGTVSENRSSDIFTKQHQGVRDGFQLLAFMLGKRTTPCSKGLHIAQNRHFKFRSGTLTKVAYVGRVWCPQTASGTWVMRQNGVMVITGNSRQSVPTIIKEIFENPGGRMATVLKTVSKARGSKEGFLPEHLGDKIALPIGEETDGTQRYLSQLGLPVEEVGQLAADPMQYALGQLNPLIKGPLEQATNRQFFSGRELSDLRSRTGAPPVLENALMNSPFARFPSVYGTLTDERKDAVTKAWNLLTGVKLTDVDMTRARAAAGRRALEEQLRALPNVRQTPGRPYIPRSLQQDATEEEKALMALYSTMRGR